MSKISDFVQKYVTTDQELRKTFYHYTNLTALESILRKKSIWLSDSAFQNDAVEFKHGFEIAMRIMRGMAEQTDGNPAWKENINKFFNYLSDGKNMPRVFIFSLTQKRDVLPHWSRYATSSQGICLGVNLYAFLRTQVGAPMPWLPYKIIYDRDLQEKSFTDSFTTIQECFTENPSGDEKFLNNLLSETIVALTYLCSSFKNDHFSDESETRLILASVINDPKLKEAVDFHFRRELMIPHIATSIANNNVPLSEIFPEILVPINSDLNRESLRVLCLKYGISQEAIKISDVPLRS